MNLEYTIDRAESLEPEVKGGPETQIFANGASKSMLLDSGIDIILVTIHKRFPPVGETEFGFWTRTVHMISEILADSKLR